MLQWFRALQVDCGNHAAVADCADSLVGRTAPGRLSRGDLRGGRAARCIGAQRRTRHLEHRSAAPLCPLSLDAYRPAVGHCCASRQSGRGQHGSVPHPPSMRPRRSSPRSPASRPAVFSSSRRVSRVPSPERETPVCRLWDWFMHIWLVICVRRAAVVVAMSPHPTAQVGTQLSGRLVNSLSGDPVPGATVVIEELKREVMSGRMARSGSRTCHRESITSRCRRRAIHRDAQKSRPRKAASRSM